MVPSLFLALALALTGPPTSQSQAAPATDRQSVVAYSPMTDTLIPPGDAKPGVRKPAGFGWLKFIDAVAASPGGKPESPSTACPSSASAIALSFPGHGGGRAPPVPALP